MRIPRVYINSSLSIGQEVELPADRAHYINKVLRLKPGRPLLVFNGEGGEYEAELQSADRKSAIVRIDTFVDVDRESPLEMELAIGISRGERMDWVVQKATELGVTRITPLFTERTEVKLDAARQASRLQHWQQVVISACEQSQRTRVPTVAEPLQFSAFLESCKAQHKLVLHPTVESTKISPSETIDDVSVLVGPEGGFSDEEVSLAVTSGFQPWQLGPRILRTETAPVAALSILQASWGDYSGFQETVGLKRS